MRSVWKRFATGMVLRGLPVVLLALVLGATCWQAAAIDAPLGAYVGCFDIKYINDIPKVSAFRVRAT